MAVYTQDPDAILDYLVNWSDWLDSGDTITSALAFCDSGLDILAQSFSASGHTVWLSSGSVGQEYLITSRIWTTFGRKNDQSFTLRVQQT